MDMCFVNAKGHIQMRMRVISPWSPPFSHLQPPPPPPTVLSYTLSSPYVFSPAFGRKWSQSSSRITWNNLESGALFSLPPTSPAHRPADPLPYSIVCPVGCVRRPVFCLVPVWAVCVAASLHSIIFDSLLFTSCCLLLKEQLDSSLSNVFGLFTELQVL